MDTVVIRWIWYLWLRVRVALPATVAWEDLRRLLVAAARECRCRVPTTSATARGKEGRGEYGVWA